MLERTNKTTDSDADNERSTSRRGNRWGSLKDATEEFPIGKVEIYETAKEHPELLRKWGAKTIVDLDLLHKLIESKPPAKLRPIKSIHGDPEVLARREASKTAFRARRSKRARKQRTVGKVA
jgi:hypothetical protein